MTIDEIFEKINARMIEGVMLHDQLANYYDFIGLRGYKRCHEYRFFDECCHMRKLNRYFINHFNKMIMKTEAEEKTITPASWYKYKRRDVDTNTARNAVKNGLSEWIKWETDTKRIYSELYDEAIELNEAAASNVIMCIICDVDDELKCAERYQLNAKMSDYDIDYILEIQDEMHDKYKKKMKEIKV